MERAQAIRQELLREGCRDSRVRRDLGKGYYNLAGLTLAMNDFETADAFLTEAIEAFDELSRSDAADIDTSYQLAVSYRKLADLKHERSDRDAALSLYARARDLMQRLARENPRVSEYQAGLAEICINAGQLEYEAQQPDAALASFSHAAELLAPLVSNEPGSARYRNDYVTTLRVLTRLQRDGGRGEEALQTMETLHAYLQCLVDRRSDGVEVRELLDQTTAEIQALRADRRGGAPNKD
jgi:tetratricopeptide (TPR) repeat protein